ncbi:MAG: hypothetical protein JJU00_15380 [Opitutales bacterium]|nr:hypothetical protein [Opitutales bacterium]
MKVWLAVVVLFAGMVFPRCCCDAVRTASGPSPAPAGCCGEPAPAEQAPCPSGGGCALEGCNQPPEAAVPGKGVFAASSALPVRAPLLSADLPRPASRTSAPGFTSLQADPVPKRHVHCVYLI